MQETDIDQTGNDSCSFITGTSGPEVIINDIPLVRRKNYRDIERGIDIFMTEIGIKEEHRKEERDFFHLILSSYKYNDKEDESRKSVEAARRFSRYRIRKYTLDKQVII